MYVKDYKGDLIPKSKARKIKDENQREAYYEMNVSCIKMPDGKWYRTTTGKILYDHSIKNWVHSRNVKGSKGLVHDGSIGFYSDTSKEVPIMFKKDNFTRTLKFDPLNKNIESLQFKENKWSTGVAMNDIVAIENGYIESLNDGLFYKKADCTSEDLNLIATPNIPASERNNTYSLDDDKDYRAKLELAYDENPLKVNPAFTKLFKKYIPFTWGVEIEIQNGFVPQRIREPLGFRTCRDGSLDTGQEYVSVPMEGGKGLQALKLMCEELSKRCVISNKCSVHLHFGDIRRDRLFVVSLWTLLTKIQDEVKLYFPYSRTNSIRDDGKIYAALLPNLSLKTDDILKITNEDTFKKRVTDELVKIYTWLNNGHHPGEVFDESFVKETRETLIKGKKQVQYCYRVKKFNYTTRLPKHAITGHKWQRPQRYLWVNFLNFYFAHSKTVEFRIHEATTNFNKILLYMLFCVSIIKYAEKFDKVLGNNPITVKDILEDYFDSAVASRIMFYLEMRKDLFCNKNNSFREGFKSIESKWFNDDKNFSFNL